MPLGLPLRTMIVTTEPNGTPLFGPEFQSSSTWPDFTRRVMSGSRLKCTMSAANPDSTLRD